MAVGFMGSRFVGRTEELGRLLAALERTEQSKPTTVLLAGDAGIGKSRLLAELCGRAQRRGNQVLVGGCLEAADVGLPYLPIVVGLRGFAADAANEARLAAAAKGLPGLERLLPDLVGDRPAAFALEAGLDQLRLFDAVRALLMRLSEDVPVLVVLEDLHWVDRSTRDLLAFLVRTLHGRVALVASYRPDGLDRRHPLSSLLAELTRQPNVERLELAPLGRADLAEHLAAVSGRRLPGAAVDRIFARSEGNPFYAEELLAAGADQVEVRLPSALADVLLARIEALSQPTQRLLRTAAVAGRRVGHQLLLAATGWSESRLEASLREAIAAHVLMVDTGTQTYAFRHALLQEAVYGDLLPGEQRRLHATYAGLLADSGPAAELAYHCQASHDLAGCLAALVRAAADASAVSAPAEAFRHLGQALQLWERVPDPVAVAGLGRVDLLLQAAEAAYNAAEFQDAVRLGRLAVDEIDADAQPLLAARAYARLAQHLFFVHPETAIGEILQAYRRAVDLVPAEPPTPLRARVSSGVAEALLVAHRYEEARRWCEQALAVATAVGSSDDKAHALMTLAMLEHHQSDTDTACALLRAARAQAITARNDHLELEAQYFLGSLELEVGNLTAACVTLRETVTLAERKRLTWSGLGVEARVVCCIACYAAGDWDEVERLAAPVDDRRPAAAGLCAAALLVDAGRGRPSATERLDWLTALGDDDPWIATVAGGCAADLACWQGDLDRARSLVGSTLAMIDRSWQGRPLSAIRPAALGLAAEAERAGQAWATGDEAGFDALRAVGQDLVERARAGQAKARAQGSWVGPEALAWLAKAEAEWTRLEGHSDPERWRAAVDGFSYGDVYEVARCQWRLAEALLTLGNREQAAAAARAAYQTALRLRAEPLRKALEALARRSRLVLGAATPTGERPAGLTPRELQVLRLLIDGRSNRQIAERLFISGKTTSVHVTNVLAKLGVHSRLEAVARARELGLDQRLADP
jgi:DNA-binding CsgD family transcriptional regulator/tetratricopeptide (TPR) repeat protein